MKDHKKHNHTAVIDPLKLETMVALGYSTTQVANAFGVNRKTLQGKRRANADLEAAYQRGMQRRGSSVADRTAPNSAPNIGELIEMHLYELLRDLNELRRTLQPMIEA